MNSSSDLWRSGQLKLPLAETIVKAWPVQASHPRLTAGRSIGADLQRESALGSPCLFGPVGGVGQNQVLRIGSRSRQTKTGPVSRVSYGCGLSHRQRMGRRATAIHDRTVGWIGGVGASGRQEGES